MQVRTRRRRKKKKTNPRLPCHFVEEPFEAAEAEGNREPKQEDTRMGVGIK